MMRRLAPLAALLLAGCAMGPNYRRPEAQPPAAFRGQAQAEAASLADQPWWDVFGDPALKELVAEALRNNFDARVATWRVEEHRARLGIERAGWLPAIVPGATLEPGPPVHLLPERPRPGPGLRRARRGDLGTGPLGPGPPPERSGARGLPGRPGRPQGGVPRHPGPDRRGLLRNCASWTTAWRSPGPPPPPSGRPTTCSAAVSRAGPPRPWRPPGPGPPRPPRRPPSPPWNARSRPRRTSCASCWAATRDRSPAARTWPAPAPCPPPSPRDCPPRS